MVCGTHAIIGAAAGRLAGSATSAFSLGVLSHALADLLPHRDYDLPREGLLLALALAVVARRYGVGSAAWYGALGGMVPDLENALAILLGKEDAPLCFPTHDRWHGRAHPESWSQLALAAGLLLLVRP